VRVVFRIISTGGGAGASRVTRYIAERDKNLLSEGPGPRPLFSEDREGMTYRAADRMLDPDGRPQKSDLLHLSVSFDEADFEKLGADEKERQTRLREVIRDGVKGMTEELNVEGLTWVAGIHRNTENPHAHIAVHKRAVERGTGQEKRIERVSKRLLPHKQMQEGTEILVPGRIGDRFLTALEKQQAPSRSPEHPQTKTRSVRDQFIERLQEERKARTESTRNDASGVEVSAERTKSFPVQASRSPIDRLAIAHSWNKDSQGGDNYSDVRLRLGRRFELSLRLRFAQTWYDRAVEHGDTYRFEVVDQSTTAERKISELDVHRRAAARAQRFPDRAERERAYKADLGRHLETLEELSHAREAKIVALSKDISALSGKLELVEARVALVDDGDTTNHLPIISRSILSELQDEAVKLNLPATVRELEELRLELAREHQAAERTPEEAKTLAAQFNVARADYLAREKRLDNFEASVHLVNYEIGDERWSLATLDKQISRRREDAKIIPERAVRLDLRALARMNYSPAAREEAAREVKHLTYVRGEVVRGIEQRREELVADRDLARDLVDVLESAYVREERSHAENGQRMPEAKYRADQMKSLESSAETLRDSKLLSEVHEWEKAASKHDTQIDWVGRAVAREIMASVAAAETKQRLELYLESKRVASLHLGNHRTGTLRELEARTLTDHLARAIETTTQRDFRQSVKLAAKEHHGRLVAEFEKASAYHDAARELASEVTNRNPKFTDKEKMNLEIYAERQIDPQERERFLGLARESGGSAHERGGVVARSR
jgi:MobL relaxases